MCIRDRFSTMKAYTGSVYVNDFNMFNRIYKVYIQALSLIHIYSLYKKRTCSDYCEL